MTKYLKNESNNELHCLREYIYNDEEINGSELRARDLQLAPPQPEPKDVGLTRMKLRDKVDTLLTCIAVGWLGYECATPLPEESARITIGVAYGLGAAAFRGVILPRLETIVGQRLKSSAKRK